ncbi:AHH domain-containing protein [Vibrio vulnificus]|nr:AHH domain-containing protein [Vibrio vulnificus]MCU8461246.1 AHH domain-containing protein [Vibrio vulnificus]
MRNTKPSGKNSPSTSLGTPSSDDSESPQTLGNLEKMDYRQRWIANVRSQYNWKLTSEAEAMQRPAHKRSQIANHWYVDGDPHPYFLGIHMETHHLISSKGAHLDTRTAQRLVNAGYVIDTLDNLVGLPATLPGACHLGLQAHRGEHPDKPVESKAYHTTVKNELEKVKELLKQCPPNTKASDKTPNIDDITNKISKRLLDKIVSNKVALTNIPNNFSSYVGCRGQTSITKARETSERCPVGCNHFGQTDRKYNFKRPELSKEHAIWNNRVITWPKGDKWTLKQGI